ncbi:MAG: serine/threonine protein kinase [Elusimicrobia bacterium]|nr:serine/threonine protein kinase [Elusimicrobiota bacterium]
MASEDPSQTPPAEDLVPAPPPEPPVDYKPPEDAPPIPVRPAQDGPVENLAAAPLFKTGAVPGPKPQQHVPPPASPAGPSVDYKAPEEAPPIPLRPGQTGPAENLAAAPLLKTGMVPAPQPQQYAPPEPQAAAPDGSFEVSAPQQYQPPVVQPGSAEDTFIGRKVGPCRVDALLGQGGMGAVYRAHHIALDRPVALKVINPDWLGSSAAAEAFLREARIAARLEDPRIVQVYDVGVYGEQTYIVMQLVPGQTLEDKVARGGPLPPEEALRVLKEAAMALAVAHKQGVVHRDVKPANIMLGPGSAVRLMDFGLSVMAGRSEAPQEGLSTMGSFDFMAPEQGFGAPPDPRMDLYSLGAVYFYALAGRPPFVAKNAGDMLLQHRESQVPDVRQFRRNVTAAAAELIRRLMSKKPAGRPPGAAHLLKELESARMLLDVDASGSPFALLPPPVEEQPEGFKSEDGFAPHSAEETAPPETEEAEPALPAAGAPGSAGPEGAVRPPLAGGAAESPLPAVSVLPKNRPLAVKVVSGVVAAAVLARLWRQACGADWAAAGAFAALAAAFVAATSWRLWVRVCAAALLLAFMTAAFWRFGLGAWALPARLPELETLILCGLALAAAGAGLYLGLWTPDRHTSWGLILGAAALLLPAALSEHALKGQSWGAGVRVAAALQWREFVSSGGLWRWGGMLGLSWAGLFLWRRHSRQSLKGKGPLMNWNR